MNCSCGTVSVGPFFLRCLFEAQGDTPSCESVFCQHRVDFHGLRISNYDLYALGYSISACSNTWTVVLRDIPLPSGLEMFVRGMQSVYLLKYGGGSIEGLHLIGYGKTINEEHLLQIPSQILQPIKSLTLIGCHLHQKGFENLAKRIRNLHNLTSLNIAGSKGRSLVKLLGALQTHGKLETLEMPDISIGMDDVAALADLVQPSSSLGVLIVGGSQWIHGSLPADVIKQLVTTVLSPSSLEIVRIEDCKYPLDDIDIETIISDSISFLLFTHNPYHANQPTRNPSRVKGGTKLSHILRRNTSLKELILDIPLDKDEVHDIIDSLKDNHSLERLWLSRRYHSQYFSESEQQALDPHIRL